MGRAPSSLWPGAGRWPPPGRGEDTAGSLTLVAMPIPAVLGVILPHVLDEVGLLQALVPGRPGYVLGSAGEKQGACSCWTLRGPSVSGCGSVRAAELWRAAGGHSPLTRGAPHRAFQELEGAALGGDSPSVETAQGLRVGPGDVQGEWVRERGPG